MATDRNMAKRGRVGWLVALLAALSLLSWNGVDAQQRPSTQVIDAANIIEHLSASLADGRREVKSHLSRLGFRQELDAMQSLEGNPLYSFSSETTIETLYRRAAATSPDEGNRFLAVLYADASTRSAALAIDPRFEPLRAFPPQALARPIRFAAAAPVLNVAARLPLPPVAEAAIDVLAETYSGKSLAKLRSTMVRYLRKPTFDAQAFDRALADSATTKDALRRVIEVGTPPPSATEALRNVLRDTIETSAALSLDRDALDVMENLSRDLPPDLDRYRRVEDTLASRQRQAAQALLAAEPSKTRSASNKDIVDNMRRPPDSDALAPPSRPGPGGGGGGSGSGVGRGGGEGHGSGSGTRATTAESGSRAYSDYTSRTFAPRTGEAPTPRVTPRPATPRPATPSIGFPGLPRPSAPVATPRSYGSAILSVRAARGIALGGKVDSAVRMTPAEVFWVANRQDDRFGRLFVRFARPSGATAFIAASRVLFADSFYAARSILWDPHDREATFVNGEILVLMSMDPEGPLAQEGEEAIERRLMALRFQAMLASTDEEKAAIEEKLRAFLREQQSRPRSIVLHPSIAGREMGWSAARVDFWFNQLPLLSKESAAINGGKPIPPALLALPISQADTWQFYEKDSTVRLGGAEGGAQRLIVSSKTDRDGMASDRSHFRVSLFRLKDDTDESAESLPKLEQQVQPLLDWLATNHHDFMRLNDLSEAFSILRWLGPGQTPLTILDLDGDSKRIATPDRVVIGKGPGVKPSATPPVKPVK